MKLDNKDKAIMECLMQDCRMPAKEIAKHAHITHQAVFYRIKRLEKNKFIERYDGLLNFNKLPEKIKMFLIRIPKNSEKSFEDYCIKNKSVMSLNSQIHYFNYLIMSPFNKEGERKFISYLKKKKFEYKREIIDNLTSTKFSILDDVKLNLKEKKIQDKLLKLDKTDLKLIELMNQGGGRDSVLELARKLKITADLAVYRFKRLIKAGYFTNFIAHPNLKTNKIKYELIQFNAKNTSFKQALEIVKKTKRSAFFSQISKDKFLVTLIVKDIEDLQKSLEIIQSELDEKFLGFEIYLLKSWILLNRLDLDKIFEK